MKSGISKKEVDTVMKTLSQFQLVGEDLSDLRQPGDFDLQCGRLDETTAQEPVSQRAATLKTSTATPRTRKRGYEGRYLDYVDHFSATVPDFKLLYVSFHVFCDSHGTHLQNERRATRHPD